MIKVICDHTHKCKNDNCYYYKPCMLDTDTRNFNKLKNGAYCYCVKEVVKVKAVDVNVLEPINLKEMEI